MNKQELASRIWQIANDLRGSIEASDYKDYILGFIFYKYLSDNEYQFLIREGYEDEDIHDITEKNIDEVEYIKNNVGYFIAPEDLFQTWVDMGNDFTVDNVITALSAFQRNISLNPQHQKVFGGIFNTLETGITALGSNATQRTRQIRSLVELIQDIPTTHDEYDVLGYIYEYLIGKFAAGAGTSSGEYFTPVSASEYMSTVIAHHLKDRTTIEVYDPTSGSGSLLLNIGNIFETYHESEDNVKFYAQEYMAATEILTRMNLLMRGIKPANIVTRNGDSLEKDFPYFDESDPEGTYTPVFVDAVVSNPPYSQSWAPEDMDQDPRFAEYGLAPKSKADYAFLLHGLYHLKPGGMMAIVLPHGVLFRGGEEGEIRKKLIEKNHINAIIGLPANIFFGTGIPTTILFLKKERSNSDVLFIDASKDFEKVGNKNNLRPMDIKRLTDVTIQRLTEEKYSRLVSKEEIIENEYNLNIPRYIDSSEEAENWDLNAIMNGGIPKKELTQFHEVFEELPDLYDDLFEDINEEYVRLKNEDIHEVFENSKTVSSYKHKFESNFNNFDKYLNGLLIDKVEEVKPYTAKEEAVNELFSRFEGIELIDKYEAYAVLDATWETLSNDIQLIQDSSLSESARAIDPNMVIRKRDGKDVEVQDGNKGRIFPYELIQDELLSEEKENVNKYENRKIEISEELDSIIELLSEEDGEYDVLNDANDSFLVRDTRNKFNELFEDVEIPELTVLELFRNIGNRKAKRLDFMESHPEINWGSMDLKQDGTPSVRGLNDYEDEVQAAYEFEEDSFGAKLSKAIALLDERTYVNRMSKELSDELVVLTEETIQNLSDEEVNGLLYAKWIQPIMTGTHDLGEKLFKDIERNVMDLHNKYATTMVEIQDEIKESNKELVDMMDKLVASESDMAGIKQFQELLGGDNVE